MIPPDLQVTTPPTGLPAAMPPTGLPAAMPPTGLPAATPPVDLPAVMPPTDLQATAPPGDILAPVDLPADVYLQIFSYLSPRQIIQAKRVSKKWLSMLTDPDFCCILLRTIMPYCREVRLQTLHHRISELPDVPLNLRVEVDCRARDTVWSKTLEDVLRRYHHLACAKPREYLKLPMPVMVDHTPLKDCRVPDGSSVCPDCRFKVAQSSQFFWFSCPCWPRSISYNRRSGEFSEEFSGGFYWLRSFNYDQRPREFDLPDPMWWYSQEDGLLVYPAGWSLDDRAPPSVGWTGMEAKSGSNDGCFRNVFHPPTAPCDKFFYRLFDPTTGQHVSVPFDVRGKIIRRVRLAQGVLILEWTEMRAEQSGKRTWIDSLVRNGHAVTAFDVVRVPAGPDAERRQHKWTWDVKLRYKWKLPNWCKIAGDSFTFPYYDDGFEYEDEPRFFSAHTATHYALFTWVRCGPDVDRQLYVWDISAVKQENSPSLDKNSNAGGRKKSMRSGPILIRRLQEEDIAHHLDIFVAPRSYPRIRNIAMDENNVYLVEEDHCLATWQGHRSMWDIDVPPSAGSHIVVTYGIPVVPFPSAGETPTARLPKLRNRVNNPVLGPQSVDRCPENSFVLQSHEPNRDPFDQPTFAFCDHFIDTDPGHPSGPPSLVAFPPYSDLTERLLPASRNLSYPWNRSDAVSSPLQPRNAPGLAPCWRHENFPCVGASAVMDYAAGVRWVARDSRPLHVLTPFLPPRVTVHLRDSNLHRGSFEELGERNDDRTADLDPLTHSLDELTHNFKLEPRPRNIRSNEVEVDYPEFWENVMGRMTLAGDERWVIGQDADNNVCLVKF